MDDLIADIEQRVRKLFPRAPSAFYSDVSDLSALVGRLRRLARLALDVSAGEDVTENVTESVTPESVTAGGSRESCRVDTAGQLHPSDEWAFAGLVEPHRQELRVHCYRMVGSFDDSEDLLQETLLRAWRGREGFAGQSSLRTWLYSIATNVCLEFLRRHAREPRRYEPVPGIDSGSGEAPAQVAWLQPYPVSAGPEETALSRETIELVFITAIQHLPPKQRATLVLRDVLGMPAADTASQLGVSVASANSALQRARDAMRKHLPRDRADWSAPAGVTAEEQEVLDRYMDAIGRSDLNAMADLLSPDVVLTMPPNPFWFVGRDAMMSFVTKSLDPAAPAFLGHWRQLPAVANGQPAAAGYINRPGTRFFRAQVLDVLRVEGGRIVEITAFEPHLFPAFGLPLTLS
ncbi:RNA polymerase subunit sigma-70 [Amycolatopsis sp. NPDC051371]|uniref:RNA polymerase subunit sigma-70 n=1 Tax=Amycolatopsis sp. NPDC051371 TaxID=3155800 RepID=UPI003449BD30